jgi:RTX calcium-binding nonapeptide repeat (4 copies)
MRSQTTNSRTRRRLGRALVAAALAACALPASASAALMSFNDGELRYDGLSGRNTLSLRQVAGAVIVSDPSGVSNLFNSVITRGACAQVDRQTMRCPVPRRVFADMDEGDDTVALVNTDLPVVIHGGSGRDTYAAGNPSFLTNVKFVGGSGFDTADYAASGGSAIGGVALSNDGVANDGRRGLDTDSIGRDVESLTGSRFADEITAHAATDCCSTVVTGGQGDDVLRAGADSSGNGLAIFEMGSAPDGADRIISGPIGSTVRYSGRTRPVNATLNFGGADDGEPGEGDQIIGGHEQLVGGQAGDTLRAPFGSIAPHNILGLGGNDQIDGADGDDTLSGDAGGDSIRAFGGNDRIFAGDGETDTLSCGDGTDTVESFDSFDNFGGGAALCELRKVGVLHLTPKALRAKAGETARLKLSWRHPRSWRQLRRVELRVYRGQARVGAVAISPRSRRISDRGAVTVLRRATRISRKGKTVSARLALRLDRKLAGRRLRVEVAAVDTGGARQLERSAGSIRIAG